MRRNPEDMTTRYRIGYIRLYALLAMILALCPCAAAATGPVADQTGLLYRWTHLHPAVYFILFLIFVLSVANLAYQARINRDNLLFKRVFSFFPRSSKGSRDEELFENRLRARRAGLSRGDKKKSRSVDLRRIPNEPDEASIVAVRRVPRIADEESFPRLPTPLEGINHPLPEFETTDRGEPRLKESRLDKRAASSQFKFSSTVDLPTPEEIERREKEQLVVSGSVKGIDGKGMAAVIVFLTDEEGNRVGQSCRSLPETGEFRVLANEPGVYSVNGYKRGFVMEKSEPMVLPIQSGKIEGYNFKMIPEGCLVQGRVLFETEGEAAAGLHVKCICVNENITRSTDTGISGQFRISGVPYDSICYIEITDESQAVLFRSDTFEILQKKELYREIKIPPISSNVIASDATER